MLTLPPNFPPLRDVSIGVVECDLLSAVEVQAETTRSQLEYRLKLHLQYSTTSILSGETIDGKLMRGALQAINYHLQRNAATTRLLQVPEKVALHWVPPPQGERTIEEDKVCRLTLPPYAAVYVREDAKYFFSLLGFSDQKVIRRVDPRTNAPRQFYGFFNASKDVTYVYGTRVIGPTFRLANDLLLTEPYEDIYFLHCMEVVITTTVLRVPYTLESTIFDESFFSRIMKQSNDAIQDYGFISPHLQWRVDGERVRKIEVVVTDEIWKYYQSRGFLTLTLEPISPFFQELSGIVAIGGRFKSFYRLFQAQIADEPFGGKIQDYRIVLKDCRFPLNLYTPDGGYCCLVDKFHNHVRYYTVQSHISMTADMPLILTILDRQNRIIRPLPFFTAQLKIAGFVASSHYPSLTVQSDAWQL